MRAHTQMLAPMHTLIHTHACNDTHTQAPSSAHAKPGYQDGEGELQDRLADAGSVGTAGAGKAAGRQLQQKESSDAMEDEEEEGKAHVRLCVRSC